MMSPTNNKHPKLPNFSFQIEISRLSASAECLNSSPQLTGGWRPSVNMTKVTFCRTWFFIKIWVFEPWISDPKMLKS